MKTDWHKYIVIALSTLASGVILACGGQTNDQGVSVSFLGVYGEISTNSVITATPTPSTNTNTSFNNTIGCAQIPQVAGSGSIVISAQSGVDGILGIQNNLYGQFFRADQLVLDFFIAGASIQPPSYTAGVSILAGPAEAASNTNGNNTNTTTNTTNNQNTQNNTNTNSIGSNIDSVHGRVRYPQHSSLPPTWKNVCNTQFRRLPLIPIETGAWMLFNRDHLPPLPFTVEITARFIGTSSAGNVYETNTVYHAIQLFGQGASSGADSASSAADTSSVPDGAPEEVAPDAPLGEDGGSGEGPAVLLEDASSESSSIIEY